MIKIISLIQGYSHFLLQYYQMPIGTEPEYKKLIFMPYF